MQYKSKHYLIGLLESIEKTYQLYQIHKEAQHELMSSQYEERTRLQALEMVRSVVSSKRNLSEEQRIELIQMVLNKLFPPTKNIAEQDTLIESAAQKLKLV